MSLEVIQMVAAAEQENRARIDAAKDQSRQLLEEADKNCELFRKNDREAVLKENRAKYEAAEERAKQRSEEVLSKARAEAEVLKTEAAAHIAAASDLIIERIRA